MKHVGSRKTWCGFFVVGLLTVHAGLLAYSAAVHSPTLNEPGHLVAGISYWQFGRFDVYKVNPPLSRFVAALPVLAAGCKTDWSQYYDSPGARPEMSLGEAFVHANGERSIWLFTIARWACIPFSLLGGYVVFRWSRELYGAAAGILSLALWCFCPNILAHGSLITPDMSATAVGLATCYTFWHWLRRPTWGPVFVCGMVLGVAELAKTTLLLFYFVWPMIWLVYRTPDWRTMGHRNWLREVVMLAASAILSIYVLNLGYGFEGTFTPLGKYRFVSDLLGANSRDGQAPSGGGNRFVNSWLAAVPVPLPKNYVEGIDLQRRDFERYSEKSYLNGVWSDHGWWYYYLEALGLKVPLGTWLLLLLAATCRLWSRSEEWRIFRCPVRKMGLSPSRDTRGLAHFAMPGEQNVPVPLAPALPFHPTFRDEFTLLFPALAILAFVSSQTGFNQHMRYVLPVFPYFFIWIGRVAAVHSSRQRIKSVIAGAAIAWAIASSLWIYPHSLSYFNEIAGGPSGGPKYLLGSNVDWGQDLLFLKQWIGSHPNATPLLVAYYRGVDPNALGVESHDFRERSNNAHGSSRPRLPPGWYAISVNILYGGEFISYDGSGRTAWIDSETRESFRRLEPTDKAAYSILIYNTAAAPPK